MKNKGGGYSAGPKYGGLPRLALVMVLLASSLAAPAGSQPALAAGVCDAPPPGVSCRSGFINANETWLSSTVYVVTSPLTVSGSATLTIQAGTVVKFYEGAANAYLLVHGALVLQGQVTFTSIRDDAAGGDTNGDGAGTLPGVGDWVGVYLEQYAGDTGTLTGTGVLRYSRRGLNIYNSTATGMTQAVTGWTFEKNTYGVLLTTVMTGSITATVSTNSFIQNTYGFGTEGEGSGQGFVTLSSNSFLSHTRFPIYLGQTTYPSYSGNTFSNNVYKAIGLWGKLRASGTLPSVNGGSDTSGQPYPYVIYDESTTNFIDGLLVDTGVNVTIPAGTVIKGHPQCRYDSFRGVWIPCYIDVLGSLTLQSTPGNKIVFTSFRDDSAGGDSNGDGAATTPAAGDWDGIYLENTGTNFHDAIVQYSNMGVQVWNVFGPANTSAVTASTFKDNKTHSIGLRGVAGPVSSVVANNTVTSGTYGISISNTSVSLVAPSITTNTVSGSQYGYYAESLGSGGIAATVSGNNLQGSSAAAAFLKSDAGNVTGSLTNNTFGSSYIGVEMYISGTASILTPLTTNTFSNNTYGLVTEAAAFKAWHGASRPALTGNVFNTHSQYPIYLAGSGWPTYSGNTFTNSHYRAIGLGHNHGNSGGAWPIINGDGGQPFPYMVEQDVQLWASGTTTFQAGAVIKFKPGKRFVALGDLELSGTAGNLTTLTSHKDDSRLGDTNRDGGTTPAKKDWDALYLLHDNWAPLHHVDVRYSTFGIQVEEIVADDTNACGLVSNSTFSQNEHGLIFLAWLPPNDNACPSVTSSTFTRNTFGVSLGIWGDGNLLTTISNSTFLTNTYGLYTDARYWTYTTPDPSIGKSAADTAGRPISLGSQAMQLQAAAEAGPSAADVSYPPATGAALPRLTNNLIQGSLFPIYLGGAAFPVYSGNLIVNSVHRGIRLGGIFNNSRLYNNAFTLATLEDGSGNKLPYVVSNDVTPCDAEGHCTTPYWQINYDNVQAYGATVTLPAGTLIKIDQGNYVDVLGELDLQGIAGLPVVFTSYRDDSVGGDTNADGSNTLPARGDWLGVYLESSGVGSNYTFDYGLLKFATNGLALYNHWPNTTNIFPVVAHNQFYENIYGLTFHTGEHGHIIDPRDQQGNYAGPLVHHNNFSNNTEHIRRFAPPAGKTGQVLATLQNNCFLPTTTYGINNLVAAGVLTATQNWWGHASGPSHASNPGSGVAVSNHVQFGSWLASMPAACQPTLHAVQGRVARTGDSPVTPDPLPGVTLVLNGSVITTTSGTGIFNFSNLQPGQYTVQPFLSGYSFSPVTWTVNLPPSATGLSFVGTAVTGQTYSVSGTILDRQGQPVSGVTVLASGVGSSSSSAIATTGANGSYTLGNVLPGSYVVTPVLAGYLFTPSSREVVVASSNVTGQNFTRRDLGEVNSLLFLPTMLR